MRRSVLWLFVVLVGLLVPLAAQDSTTPIVTSVATNTPAATTLSATRVLVISIDGGRPDGIWQASTPHIDTLEADGLMAVLGQAQTIFPPVTLPAHVSLLTGLDIDDHDVRHNNFRNRKVELPTFLNVAAAGGYETGLVVGKNKLWQLWHPEDAMQYAFAEAGDRSVVDAALEMLEAGVEVLFVHLPNTDFFGHSMGWMSDTYLFELRNTDAQIGRLLAWYDEADLHDETLIIITADHGGHGTIHGYAIPEDMNVPMYIAGPGITEDSALVGEVTVMNVAATVITALGLDVPDGMAAPVVIQAR